MDYSSSVHDADNLAGPSPWGSSPNHSPQNSRTSFGPDAPSSPIPYGQQRPVSNGSYASESSVDFSRAESSVLASGTDNITDEARSDPQGGKEPDPKSYSGPQQSYHQGQTQQETRQDQTRQERAPAMRRGPGPQYKLQAKITGLERTGRKDPILRFDVHVSIIQHERF